MKNVNNALIGILALTVIAADGAAGPNQYGQLVLHVRPDLELSSDPPEGLSGIQSCPAAVNTTSIADRPVVWFVMASFPKAVTPEVSGVLFGLRYDPDRLTILEAGFTDAYQQVTDLDWPAPQSMARVNFNRPKRDPFFEVGYFVGQLQGTAPTVFATGDGRAECYFYDRLNERDRIEFFGTLGFLTPGESVCPEEGPTADHAEAGYRTDTTLIDPGEGGCGTLLMNSDGIYENGYAWRYGGSAPPDYGAFAEFYYTGDRICSAVYDLTTTGTQAGQDMDILVYADDGCGAPGAVLCGPIRVTPGPVAVWPSISRHTFAISGCPFLSDQYWVAGLGHWPGEVQGWFIAADVEGQIDQSGGGALTKIPVGTDFPSGWNNVSVIWGPTDGLGIGCEVNSLNPVVEASWGRIKTLFQ